MRPGRKKSVGLGYQSPGNQDELSEESVIIVDRLRSGDMSLFYQDNPERILIEEEEMPVLEEIEKERQQANTCLVNQIASQLTDRQRLIWQLHAEGKTFREISSALGCSERTVFYDWTKIRQTAWACLEA